MKTSASDRRAARGFTLVELLVVIAIIGVLVGLLLPAVQSARESARRSSCINHAKQIGLATLLHESARKAFPPGTVYVAGQTDTAASSRGSKNLGWAAMILPYGDQNPLYDALSVLKSASGKVFPHYDWADSAPKRIVSTPIPHYMCPSDVMPSINRTISSADHVAKLNYVGVAGYSGADDATSLGGTPLDFMFRPNANIPADGAKAGRRKGVFGGGSKTKISEIVDGTAHTLLFVERDGVAAQAQSSSPASGEFHRAAVWAGTYNTQWPNQHLANITTTSRWLINGTYKYSPGSLHTGFGATCCFADGSVKFVSGNIDSPTWETLGGINDGDVDDQGNQGNGDY